MSNINLINHLLNRNSGLLKSDFRSKLFKDRLSIVKNLYKKDLICHYGCVNAIEFSHDGNWLISGGDDRRVLLWNVEKSLNDQQEPRSMTKQHSSNIFCLCFNSHQSRIFSGSNDDMVYVHDVHSGDPIDIFYHSKPVYGISVDPSNESIFSTAGEDGRVLLFDMRVSNSEMKCLVRYRSAFHSVMFHPLDDNFMITANAKEGASLWDNRSHKMPYLRYGGDDAAQSCMSVRFNNLGTQVVALRRRLPPILYSTIHEDPICQFYHSDYYNSCTMKSCTFAGESDEFVMSGSDDFNLYVWRVADVDCKLIVSIEFHSKNHSSFTVELRHQWVDENQMVLYGHRSIVNQVRYNPQRCLIASSGVEKVVKLWSPFEMDKWSGGLAEGLTQGETPREVYTHEEYISLNMTHDYSTQNTNEDPRMMAFFDYLVQQEIEGWNESSNQSESDHSDNTSRPDSPTSDTEPTTNVNTVKPTRVHRDRTVRRGEAGQRHKYRNRIAYLIATKRKSLKRLALKRVSRTPPSRRMKNKFVPRQTKRNFMRATGRKPYDKKIRRLKDDDDDDDDNDDEHTTESPRNIFNMPSRRQQSPHHHNGIRKKLRTNKDNEESSSTNHGEEDYASTNSNSLQSSTSDDDGSNDSFIEFNSRKRKLITTSTPDSGFCSLISPPSSSTSQAPSNGNRLNRSKQEMMKKIDNIKRNYRKNIQEDDDDSD
ncbi:unnamed protein product [Diamesa serratosioi]